MIDEEVTSVVLTIILVLALFAVAQTVFAVRVSEPFSELGVLGPNKKFSDYPQELVVGEPLDLFIYLGNHEGRVMYYQVKVKLGDKGDNVTDTPPLEAPVLTSYQAVLMNGGNETIPISLRLEKGGINRRLVFELYYYDENTNRFEYYNRWCQLWVNVTRPNS